MVAQEIRSARLDDEPALRAVDLATWTTAVSPAPPPPPDRPFLDAATDLADLLVAEVDGRAVGYARLSRSALPSHQHVLTVNGLAVAPEEHGRGIGRSLVLGAVDLARARGARKLTLRVLSPNTRARELYAACGFGVEGILRGEYLVDGAPVDDVLMARHLLGR